MAPIHVRRPIWVALLCALGSNRPTFAQADSAARPADLDSLVSRALAVSPTIRAGVLRIDAARARVGPAGARPDPSLMAGIQNQPLGRDATAGPGPDPMTMHVIGVSQTIPYRGKLSLRTEAAERDVDAATVAVETAKQDITYRVRTAYYEVAYLDQALRITRENETVLGDVMRVTEAHYAVGTGEQRDVLAARVEATRLSDDASELAEGRRVQVAALNALLERPSETPIMTVIPTSIARLAVPDSASRIRFVNQTFGARAADWPLPSLDSLQAVAIEHNPMLREHEARIAAQTARVALAQKAVSPDVDVSLQLGQRDQRPAMVSAVVSIPIPIQRSRKQDQAVAEARAELAAMEEEHHAQVYELQAQVAKLYSDLQRDRTQLALDVKGILPQARAAFSAATSSYQSGKGELVAVLSTRAALFTYEQSYYRRLADFAEALAELDQVVGTEVVP